MQQIERIKESGGWLTRYRHDSAVCNCSMRFSLYLPPQAASEQVPVVYWLSGLTCTDDNARSQGGMQRYAAELGLALVFPDTSPRGTDVPDGQNRYDLGKGAGFYVNATQAPRHPGHSTTGCTITLPGSCPAWSRARSMSGRASSPSAGTPWAATAH